MKTALSLVFTLGLATAAAAENMGEHSDPADRYRSIFTQLDVDGSGTLSKEEVSPAGLSEEGFERLETNGDGELDLDEFLALDGEESE